MLLVPLSGEELTSTAKLKIPQLVCENCNKMSSSVSFLNVSLRRRNVPSPILDESSAFPGCHESPEQTGFSPPPKSENQVKPLSDELQEVQGGVKGVESDKRSVVLTEIVGKIYLLEMELKSLRSNLNKSSQKLLENRKSKMKIRYRVVNGKMTKMLFSKYEGIKLS